MHGPALDSSAPPGFDNAEDSRRDQHWGRSQQQIRPQARLVGSGSRPRPGKDFQARFVLLPIFALANSGCVRSFDRSRLAGPEAASPLSLFL
jgi:hypothetical protein